MNLLICCLIYACMCITFNRLIAGVISYFVAGALIMKFHYKATGTDIVPNKKFWFALPLLLKVCPTKCALVVM